jgi:membrane protein DedA with SNARE-associated domain
LIHSVYGDLWMWVQAHGMAGVWVFMFVENMGVPFPTELGYIAAQSLIANHIIPLWWGYTVIVLGHLSGAAVTYYAGRASHSALGRWFTHRKRLMRVREKLQTWYERFGPLTILFGRLVGQVRPWSSLVAGMANVPPGVFWLWTVIGTLVYTALAMYVTVWGFDLWARFPALRVPLIVAVLVIFYGSMLYALIYRWIARHYRRRKAEHEAAQNDVSGDTGPAS